MIARSVLSESPDYLKFFSISSKSHQLVAFKTLLDRVVRLSSRGHFNFTLGEQYHTTSEVSMEEEQFLNSLFGSRFSHRPGLEIKN